MPKTYQFSNPQRIKLSKELKKAAKEKEGGIWKRAAEELAKKGKRGEVNLGKINEYTKENDKVLTLGKVLGGGRLEHKVEIAAFKFSATAEKKIKEMGGKVLTIKELLQKNPKGSGVKILK